MIFLKAFVVDRALTTAFLQQLSLREYKNELYVELAQKFLREESRVFYYILKCFISISQKSPASSQETQDRSSGL